MILQSMMLATLDLDIFLDRIPALEPAAAKQALAEFERAARAAIQFLKYRARIPHFELLPYPLPLITLTRFFHYFPTVHLRSRELLSRWVWRGMLTGQHRGTQTSQRAAQRTTLEAVCAGDEHGSVERLLARVRPWDPFLPEYHHFRANGASSKWMVLGLLSLEPRHLRTGEPISISDEARSVFRPVCVVRSLRPSYFGNRMIHPIEDQAPLRLVLDANDPVALASHGIDAEMVEALRERRYPRFGSLRERHLVKIVEDYVLAQTQS